MESFSPRSKIFTLLIDKNADGMVIINTEGEILFANPAAERIFGLSADKLIGSCIGIPIPDDEPEEREISHPDGTTLVSEMRVAKIRWKNRDAYLASIRDITERKKIEEKLQKSEAELKEAQRVAHVGSWTYDIKTEKCGYSEELFRIYGFDPHTHAPSYSEHLQYIHHEDWKLLDTSIQKSLQTGEDFEIELRITRPDGSKGTILSRGGVRRGDEGEIIGVAGTSQDITEQKQFEEALLESEKRYRHIIGIITDYLYSVQIESGCPVHTRHEPGCEIVTGYTSEEFEDDPLLWIRMVVEEDRPLVQNQAEQVLNGTGILVIEHRIIRKDGSERWVRNTPVPRYSSKGQLIAYDGIIQDITERKLAEKALHESEERYREVVEHTTDGIFIFDITPQDHIAVNFMNHIGKRVIGCNAEEIVGRSLDSILPPRLARELIPRCLQCMNIGSVTTYEHFFHNFHKEKFVSITLIPLRNEIGRIIRIIGVIHDITEKKLGEMNQRESYLQLEKNLQQFAVLNDSIRNPLTVIMTLTDLYFEDFAPKIYEQISKVDAIIDEIDKRWVESEKVRRFMKKHHGIGDMSIDECD